MASPVEMLGLKYPLCKELIDKMSIKWQKRIQDMMTKWPKEGTFDVTLCEEMETLIKNHKIKNKSLKRKNREAKREKEQAVLALFKQEGEDLLKSIKQARKIIKETDKETKKKEEIFAKPPSKVIPEGQFPILKGIVEVLGEMKMEGQVELENEKQTKQDVRQKMTQNKTSKQSLPLDCYKQARTALEKIKTQYEGKQIEKEEEEIDAVAQIIEDEIDKRIKETEQLIDDTDKLVKSRSRLLDSLNVGSEQELSFDEERWSQGREKGRLRKQLPILIKGTEGQYVPWASQDLEGLVTRLPNIHEGAGKWIRVFEEETMGKLLSVGDIKALLAKIIGGSKMEEILQASDLDRAVDSHYMDGIHF